MKRVMLGLAIVGFILFASVGNSVFASELRSLSSQEFVWIENGQTIATVSKTEIDNWKVKRADGFYIGLITKRGDVKPRDSGLKVSDVETLIRIQKALSPLLSK